MTHTQTHTEGEPDAAVIIRTAQEAVELKTLDSEALYGVTLPAGAQHKVIDLEQYELAPRRTKGVYSPHTVADLLRFAEAQDAAPVDPTDGAGTTTAWVDLEAFRVEVVFNDAKPGEPAWRDHRALLQLKHTPEWKHWVSQSGEYLDQLAFAEHLEDGIAEIIDPDAATMLEIAQSFHASRDVTFKSGQRLASGEVKFVNDEEITATAGKDGDIEVPQTFELAIAPFVGEAAYKINARLRYRFTPQGLKIGYTLDRPERVLRDALEQIQQRIADSSLPTYLGRPAA